MMKGTQNNDRPFVSCLCITFGRPSLLEEAIQSFLNQDYKGRKELVILNDFSKQTLMIEHPEITVINLTEKVNTLGEKRNMVASLAKGDVFFPWDDDDISLPFRVSQSVMYLQENNVEYYKPKLEFFWNDGEISAVETYHCHAQCCYTKGLFEQIKYSPMGSGEDQDFDDKVKAHINITVGVDVLPEAIYYLYRWAGTDSYHISVLDQNNGEALVHAQLDLAAEQAKIPTGEIVLTPKWNVDYEQQAKEFVVGLSHR